MPSSSTPSLPSPSSSASASSAQGASASTGRPCSRLFSSPPFSFVTYITNHALHGDMRFQGAGTIRYVYFPLLVSHIGLSVVAPPMILITFFLSLSGRFHAHRRLARFTFRFGCTSRSPASSSTPCSRPFAEAPMKWEYSFTSGTWRRA